jgi:hypothetical protein
MRTTGLLLVLGALLACKAPPQDTGVAPEPPATAPKPSLPGTAPSAAVRGTVVVKIDTLLDDYKDNEIAADAKYKGKRVTVVGVVKEIKKDFLDSPYVLVGRNHGSLFEVPQAQCAFDDAATATLAKLKKGTVVGLVCDCDGLLMNVQLTDCKLVER